MAPLPQMTQVLDLVENGTVACIADKLPRSTAIMLGYCVACLIPLAPSTTILFLLDVAGEAGD